MSKVYIYKEKEYNSVYSLRQAIYQEEYKAFGNPQTDEEWASLGVTVKEHVVEQSVETIESVKQRKYERLEREFNAFRNASTTSLVSSLGCEINANETAFINVVGLVAKLEHRIERGETENLVEGFMTFDNTLRMTTLEELKVFQDEISENATHLYTQKWTIRTAIESATTKEEVEAIEIKFSSKDFSVE